MIRRKVEKLAYRIIKDEGFVVETNTQTLHHLNPVATQIWQWIDGTRDIAELARLLHEHFDVDKESAVRDVNEFINNLKGLGLVEE